MPVAFAVLCELIVRGRRALSRALLIGWAFGLGQFVVGLNWIATAFTYQAAMPAWLGWVAVVLLSLYLAVYPALAAGLAWRFGRDDRVALVLVLAGAWAITEWLRGTMFTGFPWNPVGVALVATPLHRHQPADRHLRPVGLRGRCSAARSGSQYHNASGCRWSSILGCDRCCCGSLPSSAATRPTR